jgi:hypothetical protein
MQKDLYLKNTKQKIFIQSDDLKFDGKNLIIPSYYTSIILDYLKTTDMYDMDEADREDFLSFKDFLKDVEEFKNQGN